MENKKRVGVLRGKPIVEAPSKNIITKDEIWEQELGNSKGIDDMVLFVPKSLQEEASFIVTTNSYLTHIDNINVMYTGLQVEEETIAQKAYENMQASEYVYIYITIPQVQSFRLTMLESIGSPEGLPVELQGFYELLSTPINSIKDALEFLVDYAIFEIEASQDVPLTPEEEEAFNSLKKCYYEPYNKHKIYE